MKSSVHIFRDPTLQFTDEEFKDECPVSPPIEPFIPSSSKESEEENIDDTDENVRVTDNIDESPDPEITKPIIESVE